MRERQFRHPIIKKIIRLNGLPDMREGEDEHHYILGMLNNGRLVLSEPTYKSVVETVEGLRNVPGKVALVPRRFGLTNEQCNQKVKSLDALVKIDSRHVLRKISGNDLHDQLSMTFLERYKIKPEKLIAAAIALCDAESPPLGYFWMGGDRRFRATTWIRSATAAEMEVMARKGAFPKAEVVHKKLYADNIGLKVNSRTEEGVFYPMTIARLPLHKAGDPREYSSWLNISHDSHDPDADMRGVQHAKRVFPIVFMSTSVIFGYNEAMVYVRASGINRKIRANPFAIPADEEAVDFIDDLRLRTLKLVYDPTRKHFGLDILWKTEMDQFIGARTVLRGYEKCWSHWGKKDQRDYLFKPMKEGEILK